MKAALLRSQSGSRPRNCLHVALLVAIAFNSRADLITLTHSGTGSGRIGATFFTNAGFTITEFADTTNRAPFSGGFSIEDFSASISISGVGNFHFTTATETFVNNNLSVVGFSRASGPDLFNGPTNSLFASWNLLSSLGPVTGPSSLLQWSLSPVNTDGGVLSFSSATMTGTFQATVVPEPACGLVMLATSFLAVCIVDRRLRGRAGLQ